MKQILDACCGSRMFWFDKEHPAAVFMDNRSITKTLCDGRRFEVKPDLIADFREIPFPDESFRLVVFDPPHLCRMRIFRFEEAVQVWEGLYFYGFGEDGERGEGYFSSIEEALEHARKNTDVGRCSNFA